MSVKIKYYKNLSTMLTQAGITSFDLPESNTSSGEYNTVDNVSSSWTDFAHTNLGSVINFKEWNTASDGSGTTYHPGDKIYENTTLYAIWEGTIYYPETFEFKENTTTLYKFNVLTKSERETISQALTQSSVRTYDYKDFGNWPEWVSGDSYAVDDHVQREMSDGSVKGFTCIQATSNTVMNDTDWELAGIAFPTTGETDVLYLATATNLTYYWDGSAYVQTSMPIMTGATSLAAGTSGQVPTPSVGDDSKYLKGDGTWSNATVVDGSITKAKLNSSLANEIDGKAPAIIGESEAAYMHENVDSFIIKGNPYAFGNAKYVNKKNMIRGYSHPFTFSAVNIITYGNIAVLNGTNSSSSSNDASLWEAENVDIPAGTYTFEVSAYVGETIISTTKNIHFDFWYDGNETSTRSGRATVSVGNGTVTTSCTLTNHVYKYKVWIGIIGSLTYTDYRLFYSLYESNATTTDTGESISSSGSLTVTPSSTMSIVDTRMHMSTLPTTVLDTKTYVDTKCTPFTGATSSVAGTSGLVPAPATTDVDKFLAGDGTYKSGGLPMVILSYGNSTWTEFENAYNNNVIVYCRASSNSNPASGSQTRMAFMAYVNNSTTPTEVEFQYYRSMSSHSATAMGDQVFVYKLTKTGGWSVTTRDASIKEIKADTGTALGVSWSSNVVTLTNTMTANEMPMSSSDATTVKSSIDTLNSKIDPSIGTGKTWITNGDLNDYKTTGIYYFGSGTQIGGTANSDYNWAIVSVIAGRSDSVVQTVYMSDKNDVRTRQFRTTWSDFTSLYSNTSKKDFDVFYSYQVRDIENALLVDLTNIQGNNNRVGLIRGTTTNKPSDCSFGLRQVYAFSPTQVFVIIIGVSTDTKFNIWCNFYNVSAWEGWKKVSFS